MTEATHFVVDLEADSVDRMMASEDAFDLDFAVGEPPALTAVDAVADW